MPSNEAPTRRNNHLRQATGSAPEVRFICAIVEQAAMDAQSPDPALALESRRWLLGPGRGWLDWLDLDAGRVVDWCRRLPPPGQRRREGRRRARTRQDAPRRTA